jgi:hypothetical protein
VFTLSESVLTANNLISCKVSIVAIKDLVSFQENLDLKLVPKLTQASLFPSHFEKMKVSGTLNFFSNAVSSGLRYLVTEEGRSNNYLSTAWFI